MIKIQNFFVWFCIEIGGLFLFYFFILHSGDTAANRRKQLIEESKYLGGDMEHTHLVKGLDYALLHKVRWNLFKFNGKVHFGGAISR